MSIKVMTQTWKVSQQQGGALLILLAIADFADDEGMAYPSISTLAKKARLSRRHTQRILRRLVRVKELIIHPGKGQHGSNLYQVTLCQGDNMSGVTSDAQGGDISCQEGVTPMSPKPSEETVKESLFRRGPITPSNEPGFMKFWEAYPKKMGKLAAIQVWNKLKPCDDLVEVMLRAINVAKQTDQWRNHRGRFIPYPATWLNGGRWEDQVAPPVKTLIRKGEKDAESKQDQWKDFGLRNYRQGTW